MKVLIFLVITLFLISCGSKNEKSSTGGSTVNQYKVNGLEAHLAYSVFMYSPEGRCEENNFKYQSLAFFAKYKPQNEESGLISIDLYLRPDGIARAFISQKEYTTKYSYGYGGIITETRLSLDTHKWIDFNWRIEQTNLVINGLGVGTYFLYNGEPRLRLTVDSNFKISELSNQDLFGLIEKSEQSNISGSSSEINTCKNNRNSIEGTLITAKN